MSVRWRREILLEALVTAPNPLTVSHLCKLTQSSPRTTRYDLDELEGWLETQGVTLVRRPRLGVWLNGAPEALEGLRKRAPKVPVHEVYLPPKQQQAIATVRLLLSDQPISVSSLAALLGVSRVTVYRELDQIDPWVRARSLRLEQLRKGVSITGGEAPLRHALYELLREWVSERDLHVGEVATAPSIGGLILNELGRPDAGSLQRVVREAGEAVRYPLTPAQTQGLMFWVAILMVRLGHGAGPALSDGIAAGVRDLPEYQLAQELVRRLAVSASVREVAFLAIQARAVRFGPSELARFDLGIARARARDLAHSCVRQASHMLGVDMEGDEDLLRGLVLHLEPALDRLELGVVLPNPLLDEIKRQYPGVFAVARQVAAGLLPPPGAFPDEEIGYLAMHLGAALERLESRLTERVRAVLVCENGIGTAQLLASLLRNRLPELDVCGFASAVEAEGVALASRAEVFITTRPIVSARLPVFLVQPIPDAIELSALRARLQSLRRAPRPVGMAGYGLVSEGGRPLMLNDVLVRETVALNVPAADWKEAIRSAGQLLVAAGAVKPAYIDGMIRGVEVVGPYIVVGPGIAMPHARPEDGALRVGLSFVRLAAPVVFAGKSENPVDLVFAFAAIDNHAHVAVMGQLAQLLSSPELVAALRAATTVEQVLRVVHEVSAT